jgi:hypothetical protein
MNRAMRRRRARQERHVPGDWIAGVSAALADLERAKGDEQIAAVVISILTVPFPHGNGHWTTTHLRHASLATSAATLLEDAAVAVRASAAEHAAVQDYDDA